MNNIRNVSKGLVFSRTPQCLKYMGRSLFRNRYGAIILSWLGIGYLELVYRTNHFIIEPEDALDIVKSGQPAIIAVWHGQHVLLPALRIDIPVSVMVSRSLDGEITARIIKAYGGKPIRASGGRVQKKHLEKGGMHGFFEMLNALEAGDNVVQTADIPHVVSRCVGKGIIQLAAKSGRPVIPLAIASSRNHVFGKSWDRACLNLPFGRSAVCMGKIVKVSPDRNMHEAVRLELENELNRITEKAYRLVGSLNE